jgi:iron(III) transport system substrate-binding protein
MEGSAVMKTTKHLDAAQKLLDFSVSSEMAGIVGARACVTARPDVTVEEARKIPEMMGRYDFSLASEQRQATIDAWRKRFDVR